MIRSSVEVLTVEPILARADPFAEDTGPGWIVDIQIQFKVSKSMKQTRNDKQKLEMVRNDKSLKIKTWTNQEQWLCL